MNTSQPIPPASILLYGAGSIGGVLLYQLLQAGCNVTAVCRSNYAAVKAHGFRLSSVRYGEVTYRPTTVVRNISECTSNSFDFVLVCTKSFPGSKPSLPDQLRPALEGRPQTAIVLAQNGIMIEEEIAAAFPQNPIVSGVIYCPAEQTGPGIIDYPEMLNLIELGTYPSKAPEPHKAAARWFADLMIKGGGAAEVYEDIQVARWSKLLLNAAWNPIGALTLTSDGDFLRTSEPYAYDLGWGIMMEIVELAKEVGIPGVTAEVAEKKFSIAKKRAVMGTGREMSMLQDVRQGRAFEVEAILGNVMRLGKQRGISMPRLETLYTLTKARCWALVKENAEKAA
ncbi:ketopantoate reductase PanE/ApbA-domain-containing protein [Aspergillus varians]